MAKESFVEPNQEKGKLRLWIAKALTRLRIFYRALTWERVKAVLNASVNNAAKLLWIALCILIISFVVRDLSADFVIIEPISVPKIFAENGYTPEVASRRLRDALGDYAVKAGSEMQNPSIAPREELPNIVVPKIDLSLDTITSSIRSVLHYSNRHTVSGELIVRNKLVWLRMRVNGKEVHSSPKGFDLENPDEFFDAAVPAIMDKIRPYLVAVSIYNSDPIRAAEKADEIIARLPDSDVNVQWSHMLKGVFLSKQQDHVQAENAFRKAVQLNYANFTAHHNLGNNLLAQGKVDEAIAEYRRVIEINPKHSAAHNNLGVILLRRSKMDDAIKEFRRAIEIDPKQSVAYYNLGDVLYRQGKLDDAIKEYRRAVEADPNNQLFKNDLESALREK